MPFPEPDPGFISSGSPYSCPALLAAGGVLRLRKDPRAEKLFEPTVLQFNVTNEPDVGKELKNSFLYDFATMKEVDMTETVESAKQGFKVRNGELLASTVASIRDTKEHIKAERKGVEKIATNLFALV